MRANPKSAEALFPVLSIFHVASGEKLRAVWQYWADTSLVRLELEFGSTALVLDADEDDDSISLSNSSASVPIGFTRHDVSKGLPWSGLVGRPFGWGWVTINPQGYCDGVLLSFDGLIPHVCVNVIASSIKVGAVARGL